RTRAEWERMTRQLLGENADPFLRIKRGGYAWAGTAVLYDAGDGGGNIWTIAGHEGWHQFTQRTFKQSLPTWLEEGIATLCEGQRWTAAGVVLVPTENPERRAQLSQLLRSRGLKGIERLVLEAPADLAAESSSEALGYYAQVWALGLMLREHRREQLARCVLDANKGRMAEQIVSVLG